MKLIDETVREGRSRGFHPRSAAEQIALIQRIQTTTGIRQFAVGFAPSIAADKEVLVAFLGAIADGTLAADSVAQVYGSLSDGKAPLELFSSMTSAQRSHISYSVACPASEAIARSVDGPWLEQCLDKATGTASSHEVHVAVARGAADQLASLRNLGLAEYGVVVLDAFGGSLETLIQSLEILERVKADVVRLHDTVGTATPQRVAARLAAIREKFPRPELHVHCHDDFGLAVANTLAAFEAGADGADVSVNGVGNRAGNAATQSVVMALHSLHGFDLPEMDLAGLNELARSVEHYFGLIQSPFAPITGRLTHIDEATVRADAAMSPTVRPFHPYPAAEVGARSEAAHSASSGPAIVASTLRRAKAHLQSYGVALSQQTEARAFSWCEAQKAERGEASRPLIAAWLEEYESLLRRSYVTDDDLVLAAIRSKGLFNV